MNEDIIFPDKNEEEFIQIAEKIGYESLCFGYSSKSDFEKVKEKVEKLGKNTKLKLKIGVLIDSADKRRILSCKDKLKKFGTILFKANGSEINRFVIEKVKPEVMFGFETSEKKDFIHHRGSNLNQVLCKLMNKNNIILAFSFKSILSSDRKGKAQIIGRIMQNNRLCRKYKVKTEIYSFAEDPYEMRSVYDILAVLKV